MARDRVQPLKFEAPDTGGTETDEFPTGLDPNEDHVDCRGVVLQSDTSDDEAVGIERDASDNLKLRDGVAGTYSLSALIGGGFDFNAVIWDNAGGIVYENGGQAVTKG